MSTISSMVGTGFYSSFFNTNSANKNQNAAQNSINSLWSSYNSYTSNSMSALSGLSEIKSGVANVLSSYDNAKEAFYSEFDDNISALSSSASKIKSYDFTVGEDAITKTDSVDEDGNKTTTTTYSKDMQAALDTVKKFVDDYNSTINFLSDNSSVSKRVSRMAQNFGDTTYRSANYQSIGISVNSDGTMKIDEEKLANTIVNDPSKVSSVLGKDGLAGKAESHISTAKGQRENLFPSAKNMLGDQLSAAALYTSGAYANITSIANTGNLLNMMF